MCAATYVDNYLEAIENLPDEVQRNISRLRDIDSQFQSVLNKLQHLSENFLLENDHALRTKYFLQMQRCLIKAQEFGDEKLENVSQMVEMVENRGRQLEMDAENVEAFGEDAGSPDTSPSEYHDQQLVIATNHDTTVRPGKRIRRIRSGHDATSTSVKANASHSSVHEVEKPRKKKPGPKRPKPSSPLSEDAPIDPNESTYCLCERVSFGEMIGCDNDSCPIEWFHFPCVGLTEIPIGKWYCPKCRDSHERKRGSNR